MIDGNQAIAILFVVGTIGGMMAFAWIDVKLIKPWRKRRNEAK